MRRETYLFWAKSKAALESSSPQLQELCLKEVRLFWLSVHEPPSRSKWESATQAEEQKRTVLRILPGLTRHPQESCGGPHE